MVEYKIELFLRDQTRKRVSEKWIRQDEICSVCLNPTVGIFTCVFNHCLTTWNQQQLVYRYQTYFVSNCKLVVFVHQPSVKMMQLCILLVSYLIIYFPCTPRAAAPVERVFIRPHVIRSAVVCLSVCRLSIWTDKRVH